MTDERNSGNRNSGYYNSGHYNSGHYNSGNYNSGHYNSGSRNSGSRNSGYYNSGYYNSGHYNSGNYNSGHYNSGYFCTETLSPAFFDQPTDLTWEESGDLVPWIDLPVGCEWVSTEKMTDDEKTENPNYETVGGYLKKHELPLNEAFPLAWAKLGDETKERFKSLPNFDPDKFLAITGVDVRVGSVAAEEPKPKTIVIDGQRYSLTPIERRNDD